MLIDKSQYKNINWWNDSNNEPQYNIFEAVNTILNDQTNQRDLDNRHMRLYGNMEGSVATPFAAAQPIFTDNRLTWNICQSATDTVCAKISKNKVRPLFLTVGGTWSDMQKAKKLQKFIDGMFDELNMYPVAQEAFRDGCVFGTGYLHFYMDQKKLKVERVFPGEILVSVRDGMYGKPMTMYRTKLIHRDELIRIYPQYEKQINESINRTYRVINGVEVTVDANTDMVEVVEGWHLATGKVKGKHTIAIREQVLFSEVWKHDWFPIVTIRWNKRLLGYHGQGLVEQLTGIQIEINKTLRTIQQSLNLVSVPRLIMEASTKVLTGQIDNTIGSIIKYTGAPPQMTAFTAVNPELFHHLERCYQRAYELAGISILSAQSKNPLGSEASGAALREFNDIETERFVLVGQAWETFFIEATKTIINTISEGKDYEVLARNSKGKSLEVIAWSDINLDDDKYVLQVFPTNALPRTPSAKLSYISELAQTGIYPPDMIRKLMDFPDLDKVNSDLDASDDLIDDIIEQMLDGEEFISPEPFMNIQRAQIKAQIAYNRAKLWKLDEDVLDNLRNFMEACERLKAPPPQAMLPQQPMTPEQPMPNEGQPI